MKSVLNEVLRMQENHPGTVISIKTHHTLNLLYNTAKQAIDKIRSRGVLDVDDCDLLERSLKRMQVHLRIPSSMPPPSATLSIRTFPWLIANETLTDQDRLIIEQILLESDDNDSKSFQAQSFSWQDYLWHKNQTFQGIYLIVHGIVEEWRLDPFDIDASDTEMRWNENFRSRRTTLLTQQMFSPRSPLIINDQSDNVFDSTNSSLTQMSDENFNENSIGSSSSLMSSKKSIPITFEDGFYIRWHRLMAPPITEQPEENLAAQENYDEYFDDTFDKYRQLHPAPAERVHRRYSFAEKDSVGLYDFLLNQGDKYQSTGKCLTNTTAFFIPKEKLTRILDNYALWNLVWLEFGK